MKKNVTLVFSPQNQQEMSVLSNGLSSEAVTAASHPSAVENRPKSSGNSTRGVEAEEVRISMGFPDSPSSLDEADHEKKRISHGSTSSPPVSDEGRSRRSQEPLPQPPVLEAADAAAPVQPEEPDQRKDEQDEDQEDDEPPYDYARVPGQERDEGSSESDEENRDDDEESKKVPGKYGKVTRHSGVTLSSQETSYAEVKDLMERRDRSVTEPMDPSSVRDPMPLPRTLTDSSASHLPLPAIPVFHPRVEQNMPEEDEDDMYDSVKDEVKEAAISAGENKQELYEAMDDMDQDDSVMYESVPEELKESVPHYQPPPPQPPPVQPPPLQPPPFQPPPPKSTRMTVLPTNSPSPTKRLGSDSTAPPDSPGGVRKPSKKLVKDVNKKEKRKSRGEDEDDSSKAKKQAKEAGKKEKRKSKLEDRKTAARARTSPSLVERSLAPSQLVLGR